jgi:hypothetical protein
MVDNPLWEICERVAVVQALLDDHVAPRATQKKSPATWGGERGRSEGLECPITIKVFHWPRKSRGRRISAGRASQPGNQKKPRLFPGAKRCRLKQSVNRRSQDG